MYYNTLEGISSVLIDQNRVDYLKTYFQELPINDLYTKLIIHQKFIKHNEPSNTIGKTLKRHAPSARKIDLDRRPESAAPQQWRNSILENP